MKGIGGSWADDDIDMASISVPIERNRERLWREDRGRPTSHANRWNNWSQGIRDTGPPYIVKFFGLPLTCNDDFVQDIFSSRYTPYVKFKIMIEPMLDLRSGPLKKVAFVELKDYELLTKALKWQDLYYKGGRKVGVELANFDNFQDCTKFTREHAAEIAQIEEEWKAEKQNLHSQHPHFTRNRGKGLLAAHGKLSDSDKSGSFIGRNSTEERSPCHQISKKKSNPFGSAKPVDILSREKEMDRKLVPLNHTTVKTMGDIDKDETSWNDKHTHNQERQTSLNELEIVDRQDESSSIEKREKLSDESIAKKEGRSLAEILRRKTNSEENSDGGNKSSQQSPRAAQMTRPILLKKKNVEPQALNTDVSKEEIPLANSTAPSNDGPAIRRDFPTDTEVLKKQLGKMDLQEISDNTNSNEAKKNDNQVAVERSSDSRPNFKEHFIEIERKQQMMRETNGTQLSLRRVSENPRNKRNTKLSKNEHTGFSKSSHVESTKDLGRGKVVSSSRDMRIQYKPRSTPFSKSGKFSHKQSRLPSPKRGNSLESFAKSDLTCTDDSNFKNSEERLQVRSKSDANDFAEAKNTIRSSRVDFFPDNANISSKTNIQGQVVERNNTGREILSNTDQAVMDKSREGEVEQPGGHEMHGDRRNSLHLRRGRGGTRGRGRGRGFYDKNSSRGVRGGGRRGRNFNLHYVRHKNGEEKQT